MGFRLEIDNFRALRRVRCNVPDGVSVIVGPNGSGKTTLLRIPAILRNAYERSWPEALTFLAGGIDVKSWDAAPDDDVAVVFERRNVRWELRQATATARDSRPIERVSIDGQLVLTRDADATVRVGEQSSSGVLDQRLGLRVAADLGWLPAAEAFVRELRNYRSFSDLNAFGLRDRGSPASTDLFLHPSGMNAFTVLRNWGDRLSTRPQREFVVGSLTAAFGDIRDLEFEVAGNVVNARYVRAGDRSVSATVIANGVLFATMHLAGVASAAPGSLVALDEPENALHPAAIRSMLDSIETWSRAHTIDVMLATHSPVVLDHFASKPDNVLVFEPDQETSPVPLTELHDREYVQRFSIGRLYERLQVGAPRDRSRAAE